MESATATGERTPLRGVLCASPWRTAPAGALLALLILLLLRIAPDSAAFPSSVAGRGAGRFFAVMLGMYLAAAPLIVRGAIRSTAALPMAPTRRSALEAQLTRLPWRWLLASTALGVALHLGLLSIQGHIGFEFLLRADVLFSRFGLVAILGWVHILGFASINALLLRQGYLFLTVGRELDAVDLLDHRPLAPFVQQALLLTLALAAFTATAALLHTNWRGDGAVEPQMIATVPLWLAVGSLLFLFPLWGVHEQLARARGEELERINAAIRGDREPLRVSSVAPEAHRLNVAELMTYREHVRALGTWPFNATSLVRLALVLGIPFASWVGGALVERGIDFLLG